jgi:hypothetical protein
MYFIIVKGNSMLHAKDLRYGNKVYNKRGEVITVQQILGSSVVYDTTLNVNRRQLSKVSGSYDSSYTTYVVETVKEAGLQDIEPVKLTPQILEKCGFRNFVRDEWIVSHGNEHTDFLFSEEGLRLRHTTSTRVPIRYVHQLQNFFYAIAGQELEIDL